MRNTKFIPDYLNEISVELQKLNEGLKAINEALAVFSTVKPNAYADDKETAPEEAGARRKLRKSDLKLHPLCENCLKEGKVVPAEDVHHKRSPFQKGEINWTLLMEVENLQSLCKECHGKEHAREQGHVSPEDVIAGLEALLKDDD